MYTLSTYPETNYLINDQTFWIPLDVTFWISMEVTHKLLEAKDSDCSLQVALTMQLLNLRQPDVIGSLLNLR